MSEYENFDRQYRLIAGQGGKKGFELGETTKENPVPLHISFSFEKSDLEEQNTGKIEIWNLSKSHLAELEKKNCIVGLRAGYGNKMALIFSGYVSFVSTVADGADMKTTIEVLDSITSSRNTQVSLSYSGTVSWKKVFDDISNKIGVAVIYSEYAKFTNISNGYSYVGQAKNALDKGCNCCGLSWSIQNGVLQIKRKRDAISRKGYLISASTGMIETPEKVTITDEDDSDIKYTGYDVEYFMNGAINIDDYVKLESSIVSGYFYVYSLEINGDNIKGDWTCKARLLQLKNYGTASSSSSSSAKSSSTKKTSSTSSKSETYKKVIKYA